jgi:hypothetical protein
MPQFHCGRDRGKEYVLTRRGLSYLRMVEESRGRPAAEAIVVGRKRAAKKIAEVSQTNEGLGVPG